MISLLTTSYKINSCQTQRDRHNLGFSFEFRIGETFLHVVLLLAFILVDTRILVLCIMEMIINFHSDTQLVFHTCFVRHDFYSLRR